MTHCRVRRPVALPSAILAALLVVLLPASAAAQVSLTRIADPSTLSPSAPGEGFVAFGEGTPVLSGDLVSFLGESPSGGGSPVGGIYVGDGGPVRRIADRSTDDPDGSAETFQGFQDSTWIAGEWVVFVGYLLGVPGVYLSNGVVSARIAEHGNVVPGSAETFVDFRQPMISEDGGIGFWAETSGGGSGVYVAHPTSMVVVADETTPIPGGSGETFSDLTGPVLTGGEAIFRGSNFGAGRIGLYVGSGGPLDVLVDDTVSPAGESATFSSIDGFSADDGAVVFQGSGTGFSGLYLTDGTGLVTLVDQTTPRPGGGTFGVFRGVALSDEIVIFIDQGELFSWRDGEIERLVGPGDTVDGRIVDSLFLSPGGLDGDLFAIALEFTDDSVGIYRGRLPAPGIEMAEVPTLGEWGLLFLALSLAAAAAFVLRPPS